MNLSDEQLKQFDRYYDELIRYNEHTNLTRITDRDEVDIKHFYDSISLAQTVDLTQVNTLCDMGSGAGFPSLPLKILFPHLKITIIDSLGKRIIFLKELIETLDFKDVELVYDRIEAHAKTHQETYDLVTARALGTLPMILEMGVPMLKTSGLFVAFKGQRYQKELLDSQRAMHMLGSELIKENQYSLPLDMWR